MEYAQHSEENSVRGSSTPSLNKSRQGKNRRKNSGNINRSINNVNERNYDIEI